MKIRENLEILIEKHPYAVSLNEKLIIESEGAGGDSNSYYTNIVGNKLATSIDSDAPSKKIRDWVLSLIMNRYQTSSHTGNVNYTVDMWFAQYNKGDYTKMHYHIPFALFSFVYFVNAPRGASPLVFPTSGRKIKPEEGKVVIFSSSLWHQVPKNRCENRLVLAGNLMSYKTQ